MVQTYTCTSIHASKSCRNLPRVTLVTAEKVLQRLYQQQQQQRQRQQQQRQRLDRGRELVEREEERGETSGREKSISGVPDAEIVIARLTWCPCCTVWPDGGMENSHNSSKSCPKVTLTIYSSKLARTYKNCPKTNQFWLLLVENIWPRTFKTCPIWSHWTVVPHVMGSHPRRPFQMLH